MIQFPKSKYSYPNHKSKQAGRAKAKQSRKLKLQKVFYSVQEEVILQIYGKMADNKYAIDYGSRVAGCKKCKAKMEKGALRKENLLISCFISEWLAPKKIFRLFRPILVIIL